MQPEDLEKVKKLIQASSLLSAMERAEWLSLLPEMNDKQVSELARILSQNVPAMPPKPPRATPAQPAPKPMPTPAKPASQPQPRPQPKVDITEKEIGTSKPFYELEIPAHAQIVNIPSQPAQAPNVPAPADPTALQQRVQSIVQEMNQKKAAAPVSKIPPAKPVAPFVAQSTAKPAAKPFAPPEPVPAEPPPPVLRYPLHTTEHHGQAKTAHQPEPLTLNTPQDFRKLTPEHLHGQDVAGELKDVIASIVTLSRRYSPFEMIAELEKSSLYQTYLHIGSALLSDPNPDRDLVYAKIVQELMDKNESWLTKAEFEAFTDFRKALSELV